ncbi:MAG: VOC family protein [Sandaracinus sp.]
MANSFCHFELNTTDVAAAKKFYGKVFDWSYEDMPGMGYTMIKAGTTGGGIQKKPMAEAPTMWLSYVEVDSVKATLAKAKKAGATIVQDFMPIGAMGAIGIFVDPAGAALGVWERAAAAPAASNKKAAKKVSKKAEPAAKAAAKPAAKPAAKAAPKAAKKAAKKTK